MNRKIFVVGGDRGYASWMQGTGLVNSVEDADLVVFTGGTDVDPALYGEPRHPRTQRSDVERDKYEMEVFKECRKLDKPLIGICRGAQFLCVMAGGKLIQHQEEHGEHQVFDEFEAGATFLVSSDHHQAQFPWGRALFILLSSTVNLSAFHENGMEEEMVKGHAGLCQYGGGRAGNDLVEIEDAYYPDIKALCIQSHPEWICQSFSEDYSRSVARHQRLLDLHLKGEL